MTFASIDFETATGSRNSACAVGIVSVENGIITDEYYTLIKPPNNEYNWHNVQVHGITEEDTQNAPEFKKIYPEIKKRLQGKIVVAHNESFDRSVLQKTMALNDLNYSELKLSDRWECTMKLCRANNKYPSGKLNECCAVDNIKLQHHEALSDARACAKLFFNCRGTDKIINNNK
ncbi:MAG: 3'-5' exonuclease [Bacteroidetes bacterium]|nr:3'-5' exonuclease [Bacteroidota bacterium]